MMVFPQLLTDLRAESAALDQMIAGLSPQRWERPTPAEGWAIRDQVSHLAYFDEAAVLAATDPDAFRGHARELLALGPGFPDVIAARYRSTSAEELLAWFRAARRNLLATFGELDPKARVPWFGPDMSVTSSATARLMETWAHGQDVADTVGVVREPTARLRHIAHLGVRTFGFSFQLHGLEVPETPVRVSLAAPGGDRWEWGPPTAADVVSGPALDFCLVVTQRRHLTDTRLRLKGQTAAEWLAIAQAFAGAPGPGRSAGKFAMDRGVA
ncbi:TIGR03084 family metal-binding protein [Amycolatopsis thermoflava]|uniref:TIGR03084 family metal-binding protein n=1 Tax=Amycolatopsis thermoflava TaxID=84480 RepID=UPI0038245AA6